MSAQKIDFDAAGKTGDAKHTEQGFWGWDVARARADTLPKLNAEGVPQWKNNSVGGEKLPDGMSIIVTNANYNEATAADGYYGVAGTWGGGKKVESNTKSKIPDDFVCTTWINAENNEEDPTDFSSLRFIIKGMKAGTHTLLAYHSASNHKDGKVPPMVKAQVNGVDACEPVQQSVFIDGTWQSADDIAKTFVTFTVTEGQDVTIDYIPVVPEGTEVTNKRVYVNAFVFDAADPNMKVTNMTPINNSLHIDAPEKSVTLSWKGSTSAASHRVMFGTSEEGMTEVQNNTAESYTATELSCLNTYYWRVDEIPATGEPVLGDIYTFRINRLAFPGAEGFGKNAIGGRGGQVVHVTSIQDTAKVAAEGTLRYALETVTGPRTVVFDVSGIINLTRQLQVNEPYVTIAGQTAPGDGIMIRGQQLRINSESVTRFIRARLGSVINEDKGTGYSCADVQGKSNAIVDHASIEWATAETFKATQTEDVTIQHSIIAEALTNNNSWDDGFGFGFEAGGPSGSFHHNLMANNHRGNPTIAGGNLPDLTWIGSNEYYNNVAYNWQGAAANGASAKCNFVGNYYKTGPATPAETTNLLTINVPKVGKGTIDYYINGNILDNNGTLTNDPYNYVRNDTEDAEGNPVEGYTPNISETKVVESGANYETVQTAYARVLSEVGASLKRDATDKRIITEVANGTVSKSENGMISSVTDEDYDAYEIVSRADDFDANKNGIADWFEAATGKTDANADPDGDGYTNLEDYLNYMATPNASVGAGETASFDLSLYFAGISGATYSVNGKGSVEGNTLKISPAATDTGILQSEVTATKDDISVTRNFNVYVTGTQTDIKTTSSTARVESYELYNTAGVLVQQGKADGADVNHLNLGNAKPGVYILKIKDTDGKTRSFSILKR